MLYIVGLGPGHKDYILPKAIEKIQSMQLVVGFKRALESIAFIDKENREAKTIAEVVEIINENREKEIAVVASGDPLFYGITNYIRNHYEGDIEVIPGLSSFQYLMAKLNKPWQGSFLGSVHGREEEFIDKVKGNTLSIWLTGNNNSPENLCTQLASEKIRARVYVGEELSYEEEKITIGLPEKLMNQKFEKLAVVVVEHLL